MPLTDRVHRGLTESYPQKLSTALAVSRETRRRRLAAPVDIPADPVPRIGTVSRETAHSRLSTAVTHSLWIMAATHAPPTATSPTSAPQSQANPAFLGPIRYPSPALRFSQRPTASALRFSQRPNAGALRFSQRPDASLPTPTAEPTAQSRDSPTPRPPTTERRAERTRWGSGLHASRSTFTSSTRLSIANRCGPFTGATSIRTIAAASTFC